MLKLGVIGYGLRAKFMLKEIEPLGGITVTAIADPRMEEIRAELAEQGKSAALYRDADELLAREELDGVLLSTRCSLHARLSAKVFERGLPLFLEKPVGTSYEDLALLQDAWGKHPVPVVVSFPLRMTMMVQRVKEAIDSGLIGTVENVQAVNNVPYGEIYYADWYRDHRETGGLFLQKATHDLDYLSFLVGQSPKLVAAMMSRRVYGGEKPAGLRCRDCKEQEICMESPLNLYHRRLVRPTPFDENRMCLFGRDIENEDNASLLLEYENGVQLSYSQNFFARNGAAARGARLLGYKGTIDFDWYRGDIVIYRHHSPETERITVDTLSAGNHWGGDRNLARNFIQVMRGEAESESPLTAGITSALTCLHARSSAETRQFREVIMPQ